MANCLVPVLLMYCSISFITGKSLVASKPSLCWLQIYGIFNFSRNGFFRCSFCYKAPLIFNQITVNRQAWVQCFYPSSQMDFFHCLPYGDNTKRPSFSITREVKLDLPSPTSSQGFVFAMLNPLFIFLTGFLQCTRCMLMSTNNRTIYAYDPLNFSNSIRLGLDIFQQMIPSPSFP